MVWQMFTDLYSAFKMVHLAVYHPWGYRIYFFKPELHQQLKLVPWFYCEFEL